jgi:cell division protein YceG involved in septum cleavage
VVRKLAPLVVVAALVAGCGGSGKPAPTTTITQLHQFRVVFPEGFTRAQMAQRVGAVAKIADREHRGRVKLSANAYLAASGPQRIPGFGATKLPLEGFLFPSTYDFDRASTSRDLVREQLAAFESNFGNVDLAYAKS